MDRLPFLLWAIRVWLLAIHSDADIFYLDTYRRGLSPRQAVDEAIQEDWES